LFASPDLTSHFAETNDRQLSGDSMRTRKELAPRVTIFSSWLKGSDVESRPTFAGSFDPAFILPETLVLLVEC
jgi:hypothetical protein